MEINNLEKVLANEPKYRIKQAKGAIFKDLISDWNEVTVFPVELRHKLNELCPLLITAEFAVSKKEDAIKCRIKLKDRLLIESVLMCHKDGRNTVCVSSQVGCPLACEFCATGHVGFKRNLESMEVVEQVLFFARYLKKIQQRVTNVVFMGMGEPFLNYENVMTAIRILNNKEGLNIGARNISISTAGIIEGIKKLSLENLQVNLAVSLHGINDEMRSQIMPINKKYPIRDVFAAVDDYIKKTKRKVIFEYLLIKDFNDSDECALELAKLMKKPLYFLNLILYNETGNFKASTPERVQKFKEILNKKSINFSQRYRFGDDIQAACGQFAGKSN